MIDSAHLTEEERQDASDGTLAAERMREVYAHLASCESCARDVSRLRSVVRRAREAPAPTDVGEDLWPSIRSRIERSKVVPLGTSVSTDGSSTGRRPWLAFASIAFAAALLIAALVEMQRFRPGMSASARTSADVAFAIVADSSRRYEAESRRLLNDLEMQRAMMPPAATASLDDDLRVIDRSIAELKEALARDPHNVALQRLLAASYREKVELLERANNAG